MRILNQRSAETATPGVCCRFGRALGNRLLPRVRPWTLALGATFVFVLFVQGQNEFPYPCELQQQMVSLQTQFTAQYDASGDQFGRRVAVDGETLVVGALLDDEQGAESGAAFVFARQGVWVWRPEAKLTARDGKATNRFGCAVALSGETIVVGAYGDDERGEDAGAAYVFVGEFGSWSQQAKLTALDAAPADIFGYAVAVSGDTIVLGAHGNDGLGGDAGAAYVFVWDGSDWIQQAKLMAGDGGGGDRFGFAVAVDGDTVVVGAPNDDVSTSTDGGSIYVFVREGSNWTQQAKLTASDRYQYDNLGITVALDGDTVVTGASGKDRDPNNSNTWDVGAAYVFFRDSGNWSQQAKLLASDRAAYDNFGSSVAVTQDTLVVGAYSDDDRGPNSGSSYVFVRQGTSWSQRAKLTPSASADGSRFGVDCSLSGTNLVVGAYLDAELGVASGAAYVFGGQDATWNLQMKVTATENSEGDQLGTAVAWSGDTIALGAPLDQDCGIGWGSVHVFAKQGGNWIRQAKLTAHEGEPGQVFGGGLALSDDTLAIRGEPMFSSSGSVYLFVRQGTNWLEQARVLSPEAPLEDYFSSSVALNGNTLFVGAGNGDGRETATGAVHVYAHQGADWVYQAKLTASDGVEADGFGSAVVAEGDTLVVGAPHGGSHATPEGTYGAVYVFAREGADWIERAKLVGNSGTPSDSEKDFFGTTLTLSGSTLAVGASGEDSTYVFVREGTAWSLQAKLKASDGQTGEQFGQSLAVNGDTVLVGAPSDRGTDYSGSVYVYFRQGTQWSEQFKLTSCLGVSDDLSRAGLALQGTEVLLGTAYDDATALRSGGAYLLALDPSDSAIADYTAQLLYYDAAQPAPEDPLSRDLAAFRYKQMLYGVSTNSIRSRLNTIEMLYGTEEQARAQSALRIAKRGLQFYPASPVLRPLLLDILYDRAVAESLLAKDRLAQGDEVRLGLVSPSLAFVIDDEIAVHEEALEAHRVALSGPFALLSDNLGRNDMPPMGYQIFQDEVPARVLNPATCLVTNEQTSEVTIEPVTDDTSPLFDGYKDLVLVYQLLDDYGRTAAELVRLHVARDGPGDVEEVQQIVHDTQRFLLIQMNVLQGMFPDLVSAQRDGLAEALAGINDSLARLEHLKQILRGEANLLGFDRDFLFFVSHFTGALTNHYDSYDAFRERLVMPSGPLTLAADALDTAQASYDTARVNEDELAMHFTDSCITYRDRLRDIVGVFPGHPNYGDDPTLNPGSELDQQYRSIEAARLRILRNRAEISNLEQRIEIERRRGGEVSAAYVRYGEQRADLVEEINQLKSAQAAVDSFLGGLSFNPKELAASLIAGAANAVVQAGTQLSIGAKEAELERLAANEKAEVEGINSAAQVKTWLLEMNTLVIDSQEAALLLKQEMNRLQGFYREKADLERKLAEMDTRLARRYFADPVHRLRYTVATLRAHLAFDQAQKWLFFTARALEYKWNRPFALPGNESPDGRNWSFRDVFKLRNADELQDMYNAMDAFDALYSGPSTSDDRFDWFSVREHFLGYLEEDEQGVPQSYVDEASGETLSAAEAFRRHLGRLVVDGWIELDFSTVREIENKSFFRGPTYSANGTLDPNKKGSYLDKIRWMKIRLPGEYDQEPVTGYLSYGGVSYLRNPNVGVRDVDRPDRIVNEMTPYSTRYWYWDGTWQSKDGLNAEVSMLKVPWNEPRLDGNPNDPDALPSVNQIDVFKERSVATTGWHLAIPVTGQGSVPLDKLDDIEIYFYHWAFNRP